MKQRDGDQPLPVPNDEPDVQGQVIQDMLARRAVGISRYGVALQPFNGRDAFRDIYEELLDAAVYVKQAMIERGALHPRPPATGLDTRGWLALPVYSVPTASLVPTQRVDPRAVAAKRERPLGQPMSSWCGDPYPHVVVVGGRWLIEDGHTRWALAQESGEFDILVRVFVHCELTAGPLH